MATTKSDAELEARDERVSKKLMAYLEELRDQEREARETVRALERTARAVEQAVSDGAWWTLHNVLSASDIESLCEVTFSTPTDRRQAYLGWDC